WRSSISTSFSSLSIMAFVNSWVKVLNVTADGRRYVRSRVLVAAIICFLAPNGNEHYRTGGSIDLRAATHRNRFIPNVEPPHMTVTIVGAQLGDEGKGGMVDRWSERADVVCRYQGGDNAGHTVVHGDTPATDGGTTS